MKRASEILKDEHRVILKAVAVMSQIADDLEAGFQVDKEVFNQLVQFMRIFGDRCHYDKEEKHLFPLLENREAPSGGYTITALRRDHHVGRILLDHLEMTLAARGTDEESARNDLALILRELTELYPGHIWKEEYLLLPMADKLLSVDEQESLQREFERAESNIGLDVHHAFESMIARVYRHRNKTRTAETEVPPILERMGSRR